MPDPTSVLTNPTHPVNRTLTYIKLAVLAVSVAAAIPTARNLYFSWKNGIPFNQVDHRLAQAALLEKNFGCDIAYSSLATSASGKVEVGSCKETGDISIRVTGANGQVNYEWIAYEQLPKPTAMTAHVSDLIISPAVAEVLIPRGLPAPRTTELAQTSEVLCQSKVGDNIVRVVQTGGQCVRETVSIFRGAVEKRDSVPCDKACPIPK